jgi:hypothetical protein
MAVLWFSVFILALAAQSAAGHSSFNGASRSDSVTGPSSEGRDRPGGVRGGDCLKQGMRWESRREIDGIAGPWEWNRRAQWVFPVDNPSGARQAPFTGRPLDAFDIGPDACRRMPVWFP